MTLLRKRGPWKVSPGLNVTSLLSKWPTTSFGATRARLLQENLGDFAPKEVVAPRSDGAPRTAKHQAALEGGHDVLVLISEVCVWGGFSPEAMRFLGELAQARNDGIDIRIERASTTWSTSSFTSYHGQLLSHSLAVCSASGGSRSRSSGRST